ncbi:GNAT family N-acetyltransferase, partial [Streptomyces rochei]
MSGRTEVQVRPGVEGDLEALTDLYNHYVRETPITFDTEPFTPEERRPWLLSHPEDGPHRLRVATDAGSREILGYATSGPYRAKPAYGTSVETTVYVAP